MELATPHVCVRVQVGTLYNMNEGRKALQNVFALDLFDNVQVGALCLLCSVRLSPSCISFLPHLLPSHPSL